MIAGLAHAITEATGSLRRDARRMLPMSLGIIWGMASVMVLLAITGGFEETQRGTLAAFGDRFVLVRINRAELDRAAGGKERRLQMDAADVERLRVGAPAIRHISPVNMAYRARMVTRSGAVGSNVWIAGVLPEITLLRNIPLAEGRFIDAIDEAERRRVIVLGPLARKQLFGTRPVLGESVRITGFSTSLVAPRGAAPGSGAPPSGAAAASSSVRTVASVAPTPPSPAQRDAAPDPNRVVEIEAETFTVIGVLADVEAQKEAYVSVSRNAFVPFSTSSSIFDRKFITIYIEPRSSADKELALRQFREVMGARYGFSPDDRNAVITYFDSIERAQAIEAIFGGMRLFLSAVGVLILLIGGVGVMNVVLVSVAARTYEVGLRKALGATPVAIYTQFFLEAVLACLFSGAVGFLLGAGAISLLQSLPLPDGFSRPVLQPRTAITAFGILAVTAVAVGVYPARRAALLPPAVALRSKG